MTGAQGTCRASGVEMQGGSVPTEAGRDPWRRPDGGVARDPVEEGTTTTARSHYYDYHISHDDLISINTRLPHLIRLYPEVYVYFQEHYIPRLESSDGEFAYHLVLLSVSPGAVDRCREEIRRLLNVQGRKKKGVAPYKQARQLASILDGMLADGTVVEEGEWSVEEEEGEGESEGLVEEGSVLQSSAGGSADHQVKTLVTHIAVDLSNVGWKQDWATMEAGSTDIRTRVVAGSVRETIDTSAVFGHWRQAGYETFVEIHPEPAASRKARGTTVSGGTMLLGGATRQLGRERGVDDWLHMRILRALVEADRNADHRLLLCTLDEGSNHGRLSFPKVASIAQSHGWHVKFLRFSGNGRKRVKKSKKKVQQWDKAHWKGAKLFVRKGGRARRGSQISKKAKRHAFHNGGLWVKGKAKTHAQHCGPSVKKATKHKKNIDKHAHDGEPLIRNKIKGANQKKKKKAQPRGCVSTRNVRISQEHQNRVVEVLKTSGATGMSQDEIMGALPPPNGHCRRAEKAVALNWMDCRRALRALTMNGRVEVGRQTVDGVKQEVFRLSQSAELKAVIVETVRRHGCLSRKGIKANLQEAHIPFVKRALAELMKEGMVIRIDHTYRLDVQLDELTALILEAIRCERPATEVSGNAIKERVHKGYGPFIKEALAAMVKDGVLLRNGHLYRLQDHDKEEKSGGEEWLEVRVLEILGENGATLAEVQKAVSEQYRDRVKGVLEELLRSKTTNYKSITRKGGGKDRLYY